LGGRSWGPWEKVDERETLKLWHGLRGRFPEKSIRAKEFLKHLNLTTYHALESKLGELESFHADDEKRMVEVKQREWFVPEENYLNEPYYSREMKREAFREGKLEIERLLTKHGYDCDAEIISFRNKGNAEVNHGAKKGLPFTASEQLTTGKADRDSTRAAVAWALKQKKDNSTKALQKIAAEATLKFFPSLQQYSGEKTKYGTRILNREWKLKRDSIRTSVNQKLKPKKPSRGRTR